MTRRDCEAEASCAETGAGRGEGGGWKGVSQVAQENQRTEGADLPELALAVARLGAQDPVEPAHPVHGGRLSSAINRKLGYSPISPLRGGSRWGSSALLEAVAAGAAGASSSPQREQQSSTYSGLGARRSEIGAAGVTCHVHVIGGKKSHRRELIF